MHEYGVTPEMSAKMAARNRRWALDHPHAAMRDKGPISIEEELTARMVASPRRLLECVVWYPGGIGTAMVVARADVARARHAGATRLAGFGQGNTHEWVSEGMGAFGLPPLDDGPNLVRTGALVAARQAYE